MGTIFTLTDDIKSTIASALDDLISELGKDCRLVYPPRMTSCVNCVWDPVGKKSSNYYLHGGPVPFSNTSCPMCNGVGKRAEEVSDVVKFLCAIEPKHFFKPVKHLDIQLPYSIIQTKGFLSDMPRVRRASHMVFQVAIEGLLNKRFRLLDDPVDVSNIIQNRYFVATWEQIK